jgi:putative two-component system hydrogenase maturation factor HypX/HoxX
MGAREARDIGLLDEIIDAVAGEAEIARRAREIATDPRFDTRLAEKATRRAADEANKPLAAYRAEELARMRLNFFGFDPSYHVARYNFIHKIPKSRTPLTLARHRAGL